MALPRSNGSAKREAEPCGMRDAELQTTGNAFDFALPVRSIASTAAGRD
jgi:hypothetical protein